MAISTVTALVCILGVVFVTSFQVVSPSSVEHRTSRLLNTPPILSSVPDLSYMDPDLLNLPNKLADIEKIITDRPTLREELLELRLSTILRNLSICTDWLSDCSEHLSQFNRQCASPFGYGSIVFCLCWHSFLFAYAVGMVLTAVFLRCGLYYLAQNLEQENPPLCALCSRFCSITKENGEIILYGNVSDLNLSLIHI